jgi:hypothetical protein
MSTHACRVTLVCSGSLLSNDSHSAIYFVFVALLFLWAPAILNNIVNLLHEQMPLLVAYRI